MVKMHPFYARIIPKPNITSPRQSITEKHIFPWVLYRKDLNCTREKISLVSKRYHKNFQFFQFFFFDVLGHHLINHK